MTDELAKKFAEEIKRKSQKADLGSIIIDELSSIKSSIERNKIEQDHIKYITESHSALISYAQISHTNLPKKLNITADSYIPITAGLYNLEWSSGGAPFRWTGPERALTLNLFIDRSSPAICSFVLLPIRKDQAENQCRILIDGEPINLQIKRSAEAVIVNGAITQRQSAGPTTLTFISPAPFVPAAIDANSDDTRMLGVAMHRLIIDRTPTAKEEADGKS